MSNDPILLRVLVIEDDEHMRDLLCRGLREAGHAAMPAPDGRVGLDLALEFDFESIVLDIGLPFRDGFALARSLRAQCRAVPILMLTARDAEEDVLRGFDCGTDDYLTKPFSFRELLARLQSLARRAARRTAAAELTLDGSHLAAVCDGQSIPLSRTEYLLLACLVYDRGAVTPRERLVEAVWGSDHAVSPNALDVLVNALRGKLDACGEACSITTVRGVGYRLEPARLASAQLAPGSTCAERSA